MLQKQQNREKKGCKCRENKTGLGALPRARKKETLHYCGYMLTMETEWPAKLQRRDIPDCSSHVRKC